MKSQSTNRPGTIRCIISSLLHRAGAWLLAMALTLVVGNGLTSCGPAPNYNIPASAFKAEPSGTLAVGDVLRFSYAGAPEFNQSQKIQPNGKVSLPTVGGVQAAGRSVGSLQASLTSMYENTLNDPTVVVALEQPAAVVYVSGEVNTPGKVPLDRKLTAFEAVMESGGFSKLANPKQAFVFRTERGKQNRYPLNMKDTLSGFETQPFYLRPFDVIYVQRSNW